MDVDGPLQWVDLVRSSMLHGTYAGSHIHAVGLSYLHLSIICGTGHPQVRNHCVGCRQGIGPQIQASVHRHIALAVYVKQEL